MLPLIKHMASQQQARLCRLAAPPVCRKLGPPKPWWRNTCHGIYDPE